MATVYLAVKNGLRKTSFHLGTQRKQGRALTTHAVPVLQAIMDSESTPNHVELFAALKHLWSQAHPTGPLFETVFRQLGKDFAPGIEAARVAQFPFMRPMDDFFHFMGKKGEMDNRCCQTKTLSNGKLEKVHLGWVVAVLHGIQNTATPDLLNEIWPAFLRKFVCKGKLVLAMYLFKGYSKPVSDRDLHLMAECPNNTNQDDRLWFL